MISTAKAAVIIAAAFALGLTVGFIVIYVKMIKKR